MKQALHLIALVTVIVSAGWLPSAHGIPLYVKDLPSSFKDHCTTCHTSPSGRGGLNRFGADFKYYGFSIDRIKELDSDRDGYTNSQELAAATFPGDPSSHPQSESSVLSVELIAFISTAIIAGVLLVWLWRSRL